MLTNCAKSSAMIPTRRYRRPERDGDSEGFARRRMKRMDSGFMLCMRSFRRCTVLPFDWEFDSGLSSTSRSGSATSRGGSCRRYHLERRSCFSPRTTQVGQRQ
ncbi:unnamed protein product, partial [Nesidiocoris tenuis]